LYTGSHGVNESGYLQPFNKGSTHVYIFMAVFFRNARYPMERVYKNYQICFTLSIDDLQAQTKKKV